MIARRLMHYDKVTIARFEDARRRLAEAEASGDWGATITQRRRFEYLASRLRSLGFSEMVDASPVAPPAVELAPLPATAAW